VRACVCVYIEYLKTDDKYILMKNFLLHFKLKYQNINMKYPNGKSSKITNELEFHTQGWQDSQW